MNDIEILENLEKYISFANKQENFSHDTDYKWHKELASMIENLIQRNKNLEQIEQEHKEENGRLREEIDKKDKIINDMANEIYITAIRDDGTHFSTSQEVIKYFTNKVEENK